MDSLDVSGKIIDDLIEREGGYNRNNPADRGGPTKYGITKALLSSWRGVPATVDDVKNLTKGEAYSIYQEKFLKEINLDLIPDDVTRAHLFDAAVLHSPRRAITFLQETLGVEQDGLLGPKTLYALGYYLDHGGSWKEINDNLVKQRLGLVRNLAEKDPTQKQNLPQWEKRILGMNRYNP